jgi:uncharacterized membrane protein YhaH (DUF805 family)
MDFPTAVSTCLRKYAIVGGRASRSEYWFFQLFCVLLFLGFGFLAHLVMSSAHERGPSALFIGLLILIAILGLFLPHLCVTVRRLHDTNASGFWYLLFFIPYLGWLIGIIWCCMPGTKGSNFYGRSPLEAPEDVF